MIARIKNERGTTLMETLASTIILSFAVISLYIGILYADKQVQRNYHDRVAILHASGELDWQMYCKKNTKKFDLFQNRSVVIDKLYKGRLLKGLMSTSLVDNFESQSGFVVPYSVLEISVRWVEPGDNEERKYVVREDFY